ncbi:MAG: sugar ABC transporter substrate-binding protein [Deinococcota bacterium]
MKGWQVLTLSVVLGMTVSALAQTTVTWAMWGSPEEIATHEAVADAFMAENPDIEIEIWSRPWGDYFTTIQTLWAAGDASVIPDVMFLSPIQSYAADGVLEPLASYIEATDYPVDDYWPSLLEFGIYDEQIYGLPRDIGLEVLYYNKDIFDEVGVSYPDESWTWDDLQAAAEQLTNVTNSGRVIRHALAMEGGKYQLWVGQNGGSILDDMRNPSRCTLAEPAAVEAISYFADMMNSNHAMRDANLGQAGGDAAVFQSGQAAMIIQNASRISAFNAADMNYDVAVVPIPEGGQRSASAGGAAWTMSSFSDDKDVAWTFLSWLQGTDGGQAIYTASGEILPALQSTAESDAFMSLSDSPANRMAFITEGQNAKVGRIGYFAEWNELNGSIISPAMQRIWSGEASAAEVLPALCEDVDAFLASNGFPR